MAYFTNSQGYLFLIRFMYLMDQKIPSYSTISRFCNNLVVARQPEVFSCIAKSIIKKYHVDISDVFVDGTKLKANANKYLALPLSYVALKTLADLHQFSKFFILYEARITFSSFFLPLAIIFLSAFWGMQFYGLLSHE